MDKDLIIAIFTPTKGGKSGAKGRISGVVGTGYPLTDDLILTSRHVVVPENRDQRGKIRLRWFYDKPADAGAPAWIPIDEDDLVWVGKGDLDAALVRCRRPQSLRRFGVGRLADRRPRPHHAALTSAT